MVRTTACVVVACALVAGCGGAEPPKPAPAPAKTENLNDLLNRADAVTPKDAPDTQPAEPPGGPPPDKIVVTQRSGPAPYYGSSARPYSRDLPSSSPGSDAEDMVAKAERMFGYRIGNLAYQKTSLATLRAQKINACNGTTASRPVNAAQGVALAQPKADTPECHQMTAQADRAEASFKQMFDAMEIEATRAGIYPGVMRDLYNRHGFNPY